NFMLKRWTTKSFIYTLLLVTLLVATFLRVWHLEHFPVSLSGDEARNGLDVLRLIDEPQLTPFLPSNTGRETLFHAYLWVSLVSLGSSVFALRLGSAFMGILLVALVYRWMRDLLPRQPWIALLAAAFVATSFWGIQISRLGLRGIFLLPFTVGAYYFFWCGYSNKDHTPLYPLKNLLSPIKATFLHRFFNQQIWFVLSGISLGLAIYTYVAGRLLPLTFILFTVYITLFQRQRAHRSHIWRGLIVTGFTSMIVALPLGIYFINHPDAFLGRSSQVSFWEEYQFHHAHTGQPFFNFLWMGWQTNLGWFTQLSTPWVQGDQTPFLLKGVAYLFWVGLIRAIIAAPKSPNFAFLLIAFFTGVISLFWSPPTTLRIILALPPTYALLAVGAYTPLEYLAAKRPQSLPIQGTIMIIILGLSTFLSTQLFVPNRWVGDPPLPTLFDHAVDISANRIESLIRDDQQSVLVPQDVYDFPITRFLLHNTIPTPLPQANQPLLPLNNDISIFWPTEWERWFDNKSPSFVLLSPTGSSPTGYVETVAQWDQNELARFSQLVAEQRASPETEVVIDKDGQPIGHILKIKRNQLALRTEPLHPVNLHFLDELRLNGFDAWFLSNQRLDITLFWEALQYTEEDHLLNFELRDTQGQMVGQTTARFIFLHPGQPAIKHEVMPLQNDLIPGTYILNMGVIKFNYKQQEGLEEGQSVSPITAAGVPLPALTNPIGLIQVGEPPTVPSNTKIHFGDKLRLNGYQLNPITPTEFQIALAWEGLQPIDQEYTFTLQLLDQNQTLVAQVDHPPFNGFYPTTVWQPSQAIIDTYTLSIPEGLAGGNYQLAIGVYNSNTLERLPVTQTERDILAETLVVLQQINLAGNP
ncbi:MAG: phospholipid carrier-dependent glycosyltransferase, partial [Chloroflexota bacterium]